MPRGQYTSGKGSSAVGLTAYVTRDPDSRQLVLQTSGSLCAMGGRKDCEVMCVHFRDPQGCTGTE